jgi:hypothetical protein
MKLQPKSESEIFDEINALNPKQLRNKVRYLKESIEIFSKVVITLETVTHTKTQKYPFSILDGRNIHNEKEVHKLMNELQPKITEYQTKLQLIEKMFRDQEFFQ